MFVTYYANACAVVGALVAVALAGRRQRLDAVGVVVRDAELAAPAMAGRQPLTIGVITDVQTTAPGALEHRAVDAVMAASPDLILFPGDVFKDTREAFAEQLPRPRPAPGAAAGPGRGLRGRRRRRHSRAAQRCHPGH